MDTNIFNFLYPNGLHLNEGQDYSNWYQKVKQSILSHKIW